ncbi:hypothetical protein PILCRDRAFT_81995, partial [Piloderma croceum F 1598]
CGAVHAWTLFDKSESPTQILGFLDAVYPTPDVRPDYICIDKGCKVLRTAIVNGSWNVWKETSRFIVDSYHYINLSTRPFWHTLFVLPSWDINFTYRGISIRSVDK